MAVLSLEGFLLWFDPGEPCGLGGAGQVHALFLTTPALLFLAHSVGVNRGPGWLLHPSFSSLGLSPQLLGYQASQEVERDALWPYSPGECKSTREKCFLNLKKKKKGPY